MAKNYWFQREKHLQIEKSMQIGHQIQLTPKEHKVNSILMHYKNKEIDEGVKNPHNFLALENFLVSKRKIEKSKVFQIIHRMPKGAILHLHDIACVSEDFVYGLTFSENLYYCEIDETIRFKFGKGPFKDNNSWKLLSASRAELYGEKLEVLNQKIRNSLTLCCENPKKTYTDNSVVWEKFKDIFATVTPLLSFRPIIEKYWFRLFEECVADNVMYVEIRGTLPEMYDLDENVKFDHIDLVRIYKQTLDQFRKNHPEFNARFIYAAKRLFSKENFDECIKIMLDLHREFPDFVLGFDLIGHEDEGFPLIDYVNKLLQFPEEIKFYFHAGETGWNGTTTDWNVLDAVLLKAQRIGHGFALAKHPHILKMIRLENIPLEINPISNQVLCLVNDLRNHPAVNLLAQDFPLIISNDDPGFWGATGLSYDFYVTFMGMMSRDMDLRALKQLALNSIKFSGMQKEEKVKALQVFGKQWEQFLDQILNEFKTLGQSI